MVPRLDPGVTSLVTLVRPAYDFRTIDGLAASLLDRTTD